MDIQTMFDDFARADQAIEWLLACGFNEDEIVDMDMNIFSQYRKESV